MAVMYYVKDTPVFEDEAQEKLNSGELDKFDSELQKGSSGKISFQKGEVGTDQFQTADFSPIGIGKPMSIELQTIYVGNAPDKFLGKKDLLVTSGIKSVATHNSAPKAINQIVKKISDYCYYEPNAFNEGSSIIYYTPSLDMEKILCSFHLIADTFNEKAFDQISKMMSAAGSLPVFAPAQGVLLAGGIISEMVGKLGKAIFESRPFFEGDFKIQLDSPGQIITKSSHIAIIEKEHYEEFQDYRPRSININGESVMRLVHRESENIYKGDKAYLLLCIDGKLRTGLKNFKRSIATAAVLEKFYGAKSNGETADLIQDAMELYSDYEYYKKAQEQKKKLERLDEGSEDYEKENSLLQAYLGNIQEKLFKEPLE